MEHQIKKINVYGNLSPEEIVIMNDLKKLEAQVITMLDKINNLPDMIVRKRDLAIAKTQLQTGFMWAVRSVAKPEEMPYYSMEEKPE